MRGTHGIIKPSLGERSDLLNFPEPWDAEFLLSFPGGAKMGMQGLAGTLLSFPDGNHGTL